VLDDGFAEREPALAQLAAASVAGLAIPAGPRACTPNPCPTRLRRARRPPAPSCAAAPTPWLCAAIPASRSPRPCQEAREHRPLPEAPGRAHRATTPGPRTCSPVLAGQRAAPQTPGADRTVRRVGRRASRPKVRIGQVGTRLARRPNCGLDHSPQVVTSLPPALHPPAARTDTARARCARDVPKDVPVPQAPACIAYASALSIRFSSSAGRARRDPRAAHDAREAPNRPSESSSFQKGAMPWSACSRWSAR
jgi:hypothetical protein